MTLSEYIDERNNLIEERKRIAQRKFLKILAESTDDVLSYFEYTIDDFMEHIVEGENDDFFGTEGMNI